VECLGRYAFTDPEHLAMFGRLGDRLAVFAAYDFQFAELLQLKISAQRAEGLILGGSALTISLLPPA